MTDKTPNCRSHEVICFETYFDLLITGTTIDVLAPHAKDLFVIAFSRTLVAKLRYWKRYILLTE